GRSRSGRRNRGELRGRLRQQSSAAIGATGEENLPGAKRQKKAHPQGRREDPSAWDTGPGGQDCPTGRQQIAASDLRGGLSGREQRLSAETGSPRCEPGTARETRSRTSALGGRSGHQGILR